MPLHIALLEPLTPTLVGGIARHCAAADASLHLVGPLSFTQEDAALRKAGPKDWGALDWWVHPGWRDFRDAMARERCLYFAADAERDADDAPFRANSVLVLGNAEGVLPDRILAKYPRRTYRLPAVPRKRGYDLAAATGALLTLAAARLAAPPPGSMVPTTPMRYGRGRGTR